MRYIRLLISIAIIDKHKKIEVFNASIFVTAESEGFEPPVRRNAYTAFRVRHFRPLSQLSLLFAKAGAKVLLFFQIRKYLRIFLSLYLHFIESGTEHTAYIGN